MPDHEPSPPTIETNPFGTARERRQRLTLPLPVGWKVGSESPIAREQAGFDVLSIAELKEIMRDREGQDVPSQDMSVETILDQDGVGSCATEGAAQVWMTSRALQGESHIVPQPWVNYNEITGGRDRGSSIVANLVHARDRGFISMASWPRSKGWRSEPPRELREREGAVLRIGPFWECESIEEFLTGIVAHGMVGEYGRDRHAIACVKFQADGKIIHAGSWGSWTNFGRPGFGRESYTRINPSYGMYLVTAVVSGDLD